MNQLIAQQKEIEALKSQLKAKDAQIAALEKLNNWYFEQLKLRQQKLFGTSSEKTVENQIAIGDVFSDLFNEAEVLREPLRPEPTESSVIPEHSKRQTTRYISDTIKS